MIKILLDIEIDKLTNSIENSISGDVFDTEVILLKSKDIARINKNEWLFDWKKEINQPDRNVFKLIIKGNPNIIQGLISISYRNDHIYIHIVESSKFNKGRTKLYKGVPGNLVAFACKTSFERGYEGFVSFDAKTSLIKHYEETLYAKHFKGTKMYIETPAAKRLINEYFKK